MKTIDPTPATPVAYVVPSYTGKYGQAFIGAPMPATPGNQDAFHEVLREFVNGLNDGAISTITFSRAASSDIDPEEVVYV